MTTNPQPPTLLLTNDDGIDAPGMSALIEATRGLGRQRVVAPSGPYSGCGHTVTTHKPLLINRHSEERISIDGTPADCVRLALHHLQPDLSWVVSGINAGGNLGTDVHHSGTVAAIREAVIHGRPGVAVSHYIARGRPIDWPLASRWTRQVLLDLLSRPWEPGTFWNVNLPHPLPDSPDPAIVFCPLDLSPLPLSFRLDQDGAIAHYNGDYSSRARVPGHDVDSCFNGQIAVTLVRLGSG